MKMQLKNKYFLLRHGQNIHQTEKKDIIYCWPDDNPPCVLIEEGIKEAKEAGEILKDKEIDLIFCSDICRTKQTTEIVADIIGFDKNKIIYDERLRDVNWGILGGTNKKEAWGFHSHDPIRHFKTPAPQGESWNDCKARAVAILNEIENKFENKNILIVSHGDILWLLIDYVNGLNDEESLARRKEVYPKTGEVKEL